MVTVFSRLVYFSSILRYVKVPGDACYGGDEKKYEPRIMMCPIPSKFFLRLIQDTKSFSRWFHICPDNPDNRTSSERLMYVQFTSCVYGVSIWFIIVKSPVCPIIKGLHFLKDFKRLYFHIGICWSPIFVQQLIHIYFCPFLCADILMGCFDIKNNTIKE